MGSLPSISPPWIPEDDVKLRQAIEAGASLESLAKGAVKFSQRFTFQELRERWHSLLYDPIVSEEAASLMHEFEQSVSSVQSKASKGGSSKAATTVHRKRKAESVRSCYYAMRKRIYQESYNAMDLNFLSEDNNLLGNVDEPPSENCMLLDSIPNLDTMHHSFPQHLVNDTSGNDASDVYHSDLHNFIAEQISVHEDMPHAFEDGDFEAQCLSSFDLIDNDSGNMCTIFEETRAVNSPNPNFDAPFYTLECSSPLPNMSIWGTTKSFSAHDMPNSIPEKDHCRKDNSPLPHFGDAKNTSTSGFDVGPSESISQNQIRCDKFNTCSSTEFIENLLNTDDDEDGDAIDIIDETYFEGLSALLVDIPNNINSDQLPNTAEPKPSSDPYLALPNGPFLEDFIQNENHHLSDGHIIAIPEIQIISSKSYAKSQNYELPLGVCTLNTEDQEIPMNDDVIIPNSQRLSSLPIATEKYNNVRRKELGQPHVSSKITGSWVLPKNGLHCPKSGCRNVELPKHNALHVVSRRTNIDPNQINSASEIDVPGTTQNHQAKRADVRSINISMEEIGANPSTSCQDGLFLEDDCSVPCYSDIETMILDMELDPDDQDAHVREEVLKYNHHETKRKIIRLEQSLRACMQREIAYHEAFGVLHGRNLKHFIKKPEVLLGRPAEGILVDIDLTQECSAKNISRRQALIKMDDDGIFYLKNLGKLNIFVNDQQIATKQSGVLKSDCVIMIKDMWFIFETNQTRVERYIKERFIVE